MEQIEKPGRELQSQLTCDKGANAFKRERIVFSTNGVGITGENMKKKEP